MNKQIIHYQVSRTFKSLKQNKNKSLEQEQNKSLEQNKAYASRNERKQTMTLSIYKNLKLQALSQK